MGCAGSKDTAVASVPSQGHCSKNHPPTLLDSRTGSFAKAPHHEDSGADILNALIQTTLPVFRRGVERLLIEKNKTGGLPLFTNGNAAEDPPYKLRILKSGSHELAPGDVIKELSLRVLQVKACAADCREQGLARLPKEVQERASEVLMLDLRVAASLAFHGHRPDDHHTAPKIEFQIHGEHWWSPTLGSVEINTVELSAYVRVWWGLHLKKLFVSFLEEPSVNWDIEAHVGALGIPLPDAFEDSFITWSLQKVLGLFDTSHPLEIPQEDVAAPPPAELVEAVHLGVESFGCQDSSLEGPSKGCQTCHGERATV